VTSVGFVRSSGAIHIIPIGFTHHFSFSAKRRHSSVLENANRRMRH
jgi:hypothetical protein